MEPKEIRDCLAKIDTFEREYRGRYGGYEVYVVSKFYGEKEFRFLLTISKDFPSSLPIIYLLKTGDKLENIPHLMKFREVCYYDLEGLMWNEDDPIGIIEESFEMAFQTVVEGLTGNANQDYLREFDYYWQEVQLARPVVSLVGDLCSLQMVISVHLGTDQIIGINEEQIKDYCRRTQTSYHQARIVEMLYIPLISVPGLCFKTAWDLSVLRKVIFGNIGFQGRIREFLLANNQLPIYISMPMQEESRVHLGVEFRKVGNKLHPLLDNNAMGPFQGLLIHRMDKEYLFPRGGVRGELSEKKVCVVGCGAIGSVVVQELAKAGIIHLLLIDPDKLSKDNLYRHVLGMPYMGWDKVRALKDKLEKDLPHIQIQAIAQAFAQAINQDPPDFSTFDLIIDATAVVNTSFSISQFFLENHPGLPVLHTWLEPLGIGGHVLVENHKGTGCYKCLYKLKESNTGIYNRSSFAAPGQSFGKSMFGCAGRFTPFSSIDAIKTATLAVDLAIKVLIGEEQGHPLRSWKGDDTHFLQAGYQLSNRYKNCSDEELFQSRYDYINENCTRCTKALV